MRIILLRCINLYAILGRDWLSTRSAVAGAPFMNEFAAYTIQALPLKRRTRQRFTEFDYNDEDIKPEVQKVVTWKTLLNHTTLSNAAIQQDRSSFKCPE